jgi:hypothetical protein
MICDIRIGGDHTDIRYACHGTIYTRSVCDGCTSHIWSLPRVHMDEAPVMMLYSNSMVKAIVCCSETAMKYVYTIEPMRAIKI